MNITKITFAPRVQSATLSSPAKNTLQTNPTKTQCSSKMFAYQDYNISFGGRTPEDFYAQDFNRNNMPSTMKIFLDYDYEQRQHIPPEQMMHEVFKYIEKVENFDDVKKLYPDEELFKNLHDNKVASRKTVLSEIKIARELGDAPLLKDGSDNFGMYLLKKIYSEGKTLKEISKDFLEKDINDEYKGVVSKPIDYQTLSAFGIRFPNNAFWHSFISTREEYKKFFVTLPKNMVDPNRISAHKANAQSSTSKIKNDKADVEKENTPRPRKFKLKSFRKNQIKNDIKEANGDTEIIQKKVTKRFSKDDPEASFIVKYFSPIMTLAADRVHLSEELKSFCEDEKLNGKNGDDKYMLSRFWKVNHNLLNDYSSAVTDTIELFEDVYGGGGFIPINNEFNAVTKDTPNQHIIDFVSQEFLDLVNYTKEIEPRRNLKYQEHDKLQQEWENYFQDKYGDVQQVSPEFEKVKEDFSDLQNSELLGLSPEEILAQITHDNNGEIYKLRGKDGVDIQITANFNEVYQTKIENEVKYCPSRFVKEYTDYMFKYLDKIKEYPNLLDRYKLSILSNANDEIRNLIDDNRVLPLKTLNEFDTNRQIGFVYNSPEYEYAAIIALTQVLNKYTEGEVPSAYKLYSTEFHKMANSENELAVQIFNTHKKEINELYTKYVTKPTYSESRKIAFSIMRELARYSVNEKESVISKNNSTLLAVLKDSIEVNPERREVFKNMILNLTASYPFLKCMLVQESNEKNQVAKFEKSMNAILDGLFLASESSPILEYLLSPEILSRHRTELSPETYEKLISGYKRLTPENWVVLSNFENKPVSALQRLIFHEI